MEATPRGKPLIRPSATFSHENAREKADIVCLLPLLLTGEGARRADEGITYP
jgi:hypothetical protein